MAVHDRTRLTGMSRSERYRSFLKAHKARWGTAFLHANVSDDIAQSRRARAQMAPAFAHADSGRNAAKKRLRSRASSAGGAAAQAGPRVQNAQSSRTRAAMGCRVYPAPGERLAFAHASPRALQAVRRQAQPSRMSMRTTAGTTPLPALRPAFTQAQTHKAGRAPERRPMAQALAGKSAPAWPFRHERWRRGRLHTAVEHV